MLDRLRFAIDVMKEEAFIHEAQGGDAAVVRELEYKLEYENEHFPEEYGTRPQPNTLGLWLIVKWWNLCFFAQIVRFVITGKRPFEWDADPYGFHHGENK